MSRKKNRETVPKTTDGLKTHKAIMVVMVVAYTLYASDFHNVCE
jgi:hypothetical protein